MRYLIIAALVLLAGCATFKNTPQQSYIFDMGQICSRQSGLGAVHVQRVAPDGKLYWIGYSGVGMFEREIPQFRECMQEQFRAHPYLDWVKAQQGTSVAPLNVPNVPSPAADINKGAPGPLVLPVWHVGDQWEYTYQSPLGSGTFVWSMDREDMVEGVAYYVIKADRTRDIYFRKSDFAYSMDKVNGQIETRFVPPAPLVPSPLGAGVKWELRYIRERPIDRQTENLVRSCESCGPETITVPAGVFETFKTTCRNARTGNVDYEVWYSTAVKQMVRERLPLPTGGMRERELSAYKLK